MDADSVIEIVTGEVGRDLNVGVRINGKEPERDVIGLNEVPEPVKKGQQFRDLKMPKTDKQNEFDAEYTEHMVAYKMTIRLYAAFAKFYGIDVSFDWIPQNHFLFYFAYFQLFTAWSSAAYTIILHYLNGNYRRILEPLAIVGLAASINLKWLFHLKYWKLIFSILFYPRKLCLKNVTGIRANKIRDGLRNTTNVMKIFYCGVLASLVIYVSVPIYFFVFERLLVPLMPLEFIFVDQSTVSGFLVAQFITAILGMSGCFATVMFGSGFIICVCNYSFQVDIIAQDFAELDEMWENPSTTSQQCRYAFLCNICTKLQDMRRYLKATKEVYQLKFFLYFVFNYFGQVLCLYEIMVDNWIGGFIAAGIVFVEMSFYCSMGTRLVVEILKSIYSFYTLMTQMV